MTTKTLRLRTVRMARRIRLGRLPRLDTKREPNWDDPTIAERILTRYRETFEILGRS